MTARVGYWRDRAEATIRQVFAGLPAGVSLEERTKALDAAYPFGERRFTPYKVWLKARRKALIPFGHKPRNGLVRGDADLFASPLDRQKARSEAILLKQGGGK